MCLADGGFSDKAIPPNLLELYFYRLLLGELLLAASCLQPGGRFVCKLYSTLSCATSALLFLTTRLFKDVSIVKPMSSRVTGPERYLVAFGFCGGGEAEATLILQALRCAHGLAGATSPLVTPLLSPMVPADELARDDCFTEAACAMSTQLCERQRTALNAVLDRAEFLERMALDVADAVASNDKAKSASEDQENIPSRVQADKPPREQNEDLYIQPVVRRHRRGGA